MAYAAASSSLTDRMMRAARADPRLYEEVEADTSATNQALTVVVLVAVLSGVGAAIGAAIDNNAATNAVGALISGLIGDLLGWVVWSYVMYFVGTRMMGGTATYGELLRTVGFANAPGVFLILKFIPLLGGLVALVVGLWRIWTGFVAVRQALDLDNGKTIATIIIGIIAYIVVLAVVGIVLAAVGLGAGMAAGII